MLLLTLINGTVGASVNVTTLAGGGGRRGGGGLTGRSLAGSVHGSPFTKKKNVFLFLFKYLMV